MRTNVSRMALGTRIKRFGVAAGGSMRVESDDQTPKPRASISIEVRGDELLVYSGDPESLDDVESTIRDLRRQMPDQTRWTVLYLRVAGAEQAATK